MDERIRERWGVSGEARPAGPVSSWARAGLGGQGQGLFEKPGLGLVIEGSLQSSG